MRRWFSAVDAAHVWRATWVGALLNAFGTPLDLVIGSSVIDMPAWPSFSASAIGMAIAAFALLTRRSKSQDTRLGAILFVLNNASIVAALWVTSGFYAASGLFWVPFQANKLGALAVALLAPPLWAGLASIAGFVGTAVLKLQLLDPAVREHIGFGEPWAVLIYGAFGVALLLYRLGSLARERELVQAQMEAAAARKSARLLLAVRDLSNTPLQVIAISSAILRAGGPRPRDTLNRLDRAVDELRVLDRALRRYESDMEWRPGDEAFDPATLLRTAGEHEEA